MIRIYIIHAINRRVVFCCGRWRADKDVMRAIEIWRSLQQRSKIEAGEEANAYLPILIVAADTANRRRSGQRFTRADLIEVVCPYTSTLAVGNAGASP